MSHKNIIIAASGTGGHIYPGIAVARELESKGFKTFFFISSNAASLEIIKNEGFEYVSFNLFGMPRKVSFSFIIFLAKLIASFFKSLKYILKLKPCAVFATGGYISVPCVCAAWFLRKKTYIHEQNSVAGLANRFLNLFVLKTFISFENSEQYFKKKNFVLSGYPVRKDILEVSKAEACDKLGVSQNIFTVLIFGGSLGAAKLNEISVKAAQELASKEAIQILHITGQKNYEAVMSETKGKKYYKVFAYMHDIKYAYAASDAVVSRAGAGAVFELKTLNKPAVLVPYPCAAGNHQFYNAKELSSAIVIEEKDLSPKKLGEAIMQLRSRARNTDIKTGALLPALETMSQEAMPQEAIPQEALPQEIISQEIISQVRLS